jgi:hypothetical protein
VNSHVPIMLDYYDAKSPSSQLVATFTECEFRVSLELIRVWKSPNGVLALLLTFFAVLQGNRYFGMGSMHSLIYANSAQNSIVVRQSLFEYNDMIVNNTRVRTLQSRWFFRRKLQLLIMDGYPIKCFAA